MTLLLSVPLGVRADGPDPATNQPASIVPVPPAATPSSLQTDQPDSSFLERHPEVAQPLPPGSSTLSLPSGATPDRASTTVEQAGADQSPFHFFDQVGEPEELPNHLLVVYNSNDPDSKGLADYYAARRNIPPERVLAIACPATETVTRAEYEETIRQPIIDYLSQKDWIARQSMLVRLGSRTVNVLVATRNEIWAMALMRGVPLKISNDFADKDSMEPEPVMQTNAAAVDSELAVLPVFGLPKGGYVPNAFFDDKMTGLGRVGPLLAAKIIMVCRLDGPTPNDVRRMIDDSLYAEQNRLAGLAVVDSRGLTDPKNGHTPGDIWLRTSRDLLVKDGWLVKFDDKPDVLPPTDPCNQVALYLGWYSETACGPWVTPPDRFLRGAIAYHLHSYSASTIRSDTANWVGPLIAHGAAATMGMVYEPYLMFTPHLDIFTKRLLDGDYFCEAAYASEPALSWMGTVVGDPLYRPFRKPFESALAGVGVPHTDHDDWLLLQQVQRELASGQIQNDAGILEKSLEVTGAGPVAYEGLGDLLEKLKDPQASRDVPQVYQKAQAGETLPVDRIRVGLKLARYFTEHGMTGRAEAELEHLRQDNPEEAQRFGVPDVLLPASSKGPSTQPPAQAKQNGNATSVSTTPKSSQPPRLPALPQQAPAPE